MPLQYFALDSTHGDFATVVAALGTLNAANFSYTPTLVQRPCSHASDIKIVAAIVEEGNLTGDLADLHTDNYPNALCRHRFPSRAAARLQAFHMLGESVRSYEKVAGRKVRFIRPMLANTSLNYGAGNGTTHYDAFNGARDLAIGTDDDAGTAANRHRTGRTYFWCFGAHWVRGTGTNPGDGSGVAAEGRIYMEDPTGLGAAGAIRARCDDPMRPALALGGGSTRHEGSGTLAWEEYDSTNHIYVHGGFNDGGTTGLGQTQVMPEADIEDVTVSETTLRFRHLLKGHTDLANLAGSGGRCRFYAQASGPNRAPWLKVILFDGASFTDVTTEANDTGFGHVTDLIPAGMADNAAVYFVLDSQFSCVYLDMSQKRVGGTFVWEYGRASDYAQLTGTSLSDPTNALSTGILFGESVTFNPKLDWAQTTVATGEAFETTGWVVRLRKTGGTVTTAGRVDFSQSQKRAVFVHRWNDTAPVNGLLRNHGGLRYVTGLGGGNPSEFANVELVNFRGFVMSAFGDTIGETEGLTLKGSQIAVYGGLLTAGGHRRLIFPYSDPAVDGGGIFWARSDIGVIGIDHPFFQEILAEPGADQTKFRENEWWSDIVSCSNALYQTNAGSWHLTINGLRIRRVGMKFSTLNDVDAINLFLDPGDNHSLGLHGGYDATTVSVQQLGIEEHVQAISTYVTATGNRDKPVSGSGTSFFGVHFSYGYHWKWNGSDDPQQGAMCFNFTGDNDAGSTYEDGTGACYDNQVNYWYMYDEAPNHCAGIGTTLEGVGATAGVVARHVIFDGKHTAFFTLQNYDESCHVMHLDPAGPTFTEITNNVKESGNTATALFPTGATGEKIYLGVSTRFFRRFRFNVSTAGVGTATLTWRYWNGSAFAAVSSLSDATNNFKTSGNDRAVSFNRPADAALVTVNGQQRYWVEVEITSGSYTTVPQANQVLGRRPGASIDIQNYTVRHVPANGYIGRTIGAFWYDEASWLIDDHAVIELDPGQSSSTPFYRTVSGSGNPDMDLATWQAQAAFKSSLICDAEIDSVLGPNNQFVS